MAATLPLTLGFSPAAPRHTPGKAPARSDTPAAKPAVRVETREPVAAADEMAAWVRHAEAANGFGGDATPARPLSYRLLLQARANRSDYFGELIAAALAKAAAGAREVLATYRRQREARVMRKGLRDLDDRTLRDIGFTRSEIESVVAEATGGAEWTRLRTRWLHSQP